MPRAEIPQKRWLFAAVTALSGFAGLGYEMVWTRALAISLGHEIVAVLGVLAALFTGLALGSLVVGRRIARSDRPWLWYASLECIIGTWACALILLLPALSNLTPLLVPVDASGGRQWIVSFALPLVVLLPSTMAMGATLPALETILVRNFALHRAVSWAYAANTLGAVAGTLLSVTVLMPRLGLSRTLVSLAFVNFACAAVVAVQFRNSRASEPATNLTRERRAWPYALFVTGLLGIGYEVVAVRTLNQVLENTVYTFAALLTVYLLGTGLGAALYGRWSHGAERKNATTWLASGTSLACLSGMIVLGNLGAIEKHVHGSGDSLWAATLAELSVAAGVFLAPTFFMGALFAHLAQHFRDRDGEFGLPLAFNTAGAALAPILFGPILFPLLGGKALVALIAIGFACIAMERTRSALLPRAAAMSVAMVAFISPLSLRFIGLPPGGSLVWHRDGMMASVSVVQDQAGDRHLEINRHFRMGGTASIRSDYREADIPLLLHPDPRRALFLGLGTGATISAAQDHPGLAIDGVELVPEVTEAFPLFGKAAPNLTGATGIQIHAADARRFVTAARDERYDVIVADVYHPWIDGAGALYTREHFAAIQRLLPKDGLFCQWLPLHQLDLPTLKVIIRTFLAVYPNTQAYLAQFSIGTPLIGLVGSAAPRAHKDTWFQERVVDDRLRARLRAVDIDSEFAVFGLLLGDQSQLSSFVGAGPINTDDNQVVTFGAPHLAYLRDPPGNRLVALLDQLHAQTNSVLQNDSVLTERLAAYWRARDRYLALGVQTLNTTSQRDVIADLAPELISIVRTSADFNSAYFPVLAMIDQLAGTNPKAARVLLQDLDAASPDRPQARQRLAALPN